MPPKKTFLCRQTNNVVMRKYYFLFSLIILSIAVKAQTTTSVLSVAGGSDKNESLSLDWVLGETFIETIATGDGMYTQGFLQPILVVEKRVQNVLPHYLKIVIAPNPVQSLLNVKILTPVNERLLLTLTDINGRILLSRSLSPKQTIETLNLSNIAHATYIMHIRNVNGSLVKSFLVNKIK